MATQPVAAQLAPVVQLEDVLIALAPRCARVRGQGEVDALASQGLAERLAERRRLPCQHVLGPSMTTASLPEPAHDLGHLHSDRPAAEDEQAPWHGLHRGRLAAGPDTVELTKAGNGRYDRIGAVCKHHVVGRVAHAVDLDDARARKPAVAAQQVDAVIRQPALVAGVGEVGDHEVAPRERRLDVDLGARRRLACPVGGLARPQQRLRRTQAQ